MRNKKMMYRYTFRHLPIIMGIGMLFFLSCSEKEDERPGLPYDPSKPVVLHTFYPDSGIYLEKVMLTGENFGNNPENIKVYFNNRKAPVIGTTGTRMYVLAPRLPGDLCTLSVVVGNDSVAYDEQFKYTTSVTVTTIAGNGNVDIYQDGDLNNSILQPRYIAVDNENNVFVITGTIPQEQNAHIARIDEEENELVTIARDIFANVPAADPETGIISIPTETTVGSFYTLDPKERWAPRFHEMKWPATGERPARGWKHAMVVNPEDGHIYTRYYYGHIVKINPKTYEVETLYITHQGDSFGLTFRPNEPNILYISFFDDHSIYSIDVTNPDNTFKRLNGVAAGHRDGLLASAQFRNPSQIFQDEDGNIYVADSGNHCIRRITTENMVETVLGMPGTAGWKDGGKDEALFNGPRGLGISKDGSIYVADYGNYRVRKLSIN